MGSTGEITIISYYDDLDLVNSVFLASAILKTNDKRRLLQSIIINNDEKESEIISLLNLEILTPFQENLIGRKLLYLLFLIILRRSYLNAY